MLDQLADAVQAIEQSDDLDPVRLRSLIDRQEAVFARVAHGSVKRGEHHLSGRTPVSWLANECSMSPTSASDRLCVGEQLEAMPQVAAAVREGRLGYQSAAIICHLRDKLGEKREVIDEEWWIGLAKQQSVKNLRWIAQHVRYLVDPDGFDHDAEEDYEQRYLHLSAMGSMYKLDAVLDQETGAALRAAIDGLSKRLGEEDRRTPKQRRTDAFSEVVRHALDKGTLPRHNRVRPHISVNMTTDGFAELQNGMPISRKTAQRIACDGMLSRVVKSGSVVIDVGRATPNVSPAQWRALKARHSTCGWTGCDRPISWTSPHHIEFRSRGGPTTMRNLLPLCYHHHRLVHEGGWQIIRAGEDLKFIPPDRYRTFPTRRRWGEVAA